MGLEASKEDVSFITFDIPTSLRPIYPFLYDAQKYLRLIQFQPLSANSCKKLAAACINHGLKLWAMLNVEAIDPPGQACMDKYIIIRDRINSELNLSPEPVYSQVLNGKINYSSQELLIAEADIVLALAEEQLHEGFRFDAMLNYHIASVYYRVMESLLPNLADHVNTRLQYASWKTKQCSHLTQNFLMEYVNKTTCADVYDIHGTSKLGKGSYGSVYLATHRVTQDQRAIKVMNVDRVTAYYLRKLHMEIVTLKCLDHPNIIKLHEVFYGKRSVYLVTDLCKGGELFELLNSGKTQGFVFREDRASKLMRDMLSAVHYLHSMGIVHRDLKLENFLFKTKNASSPLVLIDFGLSRHFQPTDRLNQRVGSCYYTAPEVLTGYYDHRCDNWSLGVLCYMLLSGSPPFYGKSVDDVYNATLTQEPVYPDKKFRHVSAHCMDFMQKLLVKDPTKRMSTGDALSHPFITGVVSILPPITSRASSSSALLSITGQAAAVSPASSAAGGFLGQFWLSNSSNTVVPEPPVDKKQNVNKIMYSLPADVAEDLVQGMWAFCNANSLIRLVLEIMANYIALDNVPDLVRDFQSIDVTFSGSVSDVEFAYAIRQSQTIISGAVSAQQLFSVMALGASLGHGNRLSLHEFLAATFFRRVDIDEQRVELAFNTLDPDNRKVLSVESVRKSLGGDLSVGAIEEIIRSGDVDRDNVVSLNDLLQVWRLFWVSVTRGKRASHSAAEGALPAITTSSNTSALPQASGASNTANHSQHANLLHQQHQPHFTHLQPMPPMQSHSGGGSMAISSSSSSHASGHSSAHSTATSATLPSFESHGRSSLGGSAAGVLSYHQVDVVMMDES